MATARSLTAMNAIGSEDSESARGDAMPRVRDDSPQTRRSPPTLSKSPLTPRPGAQGGGAGPLDDRALGDRVEAKRGVGEAFRSMSGGVQPPGGRSHDGTSLLQLA